MRSVSERATLWSSESATTRMAGQDSMGLRRMSGRLERHLKENGFKVKLVMDPERSVMERDQGVRRPPREEGGQQAFLLRRSRVLAKKRIWWADGIPGPKRRTLTKPGPRWI